MLESVLVYFFLYFVMALCGRLKADKSDKYIGESGEYPEENRFFSPEMVVLVLSFTFVFGCRWGVGRDYFRYLEAYTYGSYERYEYLFRSIIVLLKRANVHFSVYFGIWAFLDVFLLYYAFRNYKFVFPYIAFFLIFGSHYLNMMNAIRQGISALFFLVSISYIDNKRPIAFVLCTIVAVLFHRLALILFVFYPLLRLSDDWFKSIGLQLVIYFIAVFFYFNGEYVLEWIEAPFEWLSGLLEYDDYYDYEDLTSDRFDRSQFGRNTGLGIWINMFRTIPIILLSKNLKAYYNSSHFNMLYTLYFIGVLCALVFGKSVILNRVTYYFDFFQIIIYSLFVYYCFDTKKAQYQVLGLLLMLLYILLFFNTISNPSTLSQYLFFWQRY